MGEILQPLSTTSLRERTYELLQEFIIDGTLKPGQRLVEQDLAKQLQVSRGPVREALYMLHRDGWVDHKPRHGAVVHSPTDQEVDDFFDVRQLLESEVARRVSLRGEVSDVRALEKVLELGNAAVVRDDGKALAQANGEFHHRVTMLAGNHLLGQLIDSISKRSAWYWAPYFSDRAAAAWKEHGEIVDAIARRAPEDAAELMQQHLEAAREAHCALRRKHRLG